MLNSEELIISEIIVSNSISEIPNELQLEAPFFYAMTTNPLYIFFSANVVLFHPVWRAVIGAKDFAR